MNYPDSLVADSARRLFADLSGADANRAMIDGRWSAQGWETLEASGFSRILCVEAEDLPQGWADAWSVFHAVGRHGLPLPLAETGIAAALLSAAGLDVPDGSLSPVPLTPSLTVLRQGRDLVLDGVAHGVPWARHAKGLVVEVEVDGQWHIAFVPTGSDALAIETSANLAGEPRDTVRFSGVKAMASAPSGLPRDAILRMGAVARSTMIAGAAEWALSQAVGFANERRQFGKPIGKFQAIQQQLAVAAGEVAAASTASMVACFQAGRVPAWFDAAVAKVRSGKAAGIVAAIAHQVHGAIGFTEEHSLHLATQRLWSWRAESGSDGWWARQLGEAAIGRGGDALWPGVTARGIEPGAAPGGSARRGEGLVA
jgi:acyl-CoA dehydrogenase